MATSVVGSLVVQLTANSARFQNELRRTNRATNTWATRTRRQVNATGRAVAGIGAAFTAATAAIVSSQLDVVDSLGKTSDKLGITTEALQGLRFAGEQTGVSARTLDTALQRMTRRLADASTGAGPAADALERLGLNARELATQTPDEAFRQIADAMAEVENQSERVRLAFALFDSEGVGLVNTLARGREGLDSMARQLDELGGRLSRFDVAQVERANDAFNTVGNAIRIAGQRLAVELAPYLESAAQWFLELVRQAGGFGNVVQRGFSLAVDAMAGFLDALNFVRQGWVLLGSVAADAIAGILEGAVALADYFGQELPESIGNSAAAFRMWADDLAADAVEIENSITFTDALAEFRGGIEASRLEWEAMADSIEGQVRPAIESVTELTKEQEQQARALGEQWAARFSGMQQELRKDYEVAGEQIGQFHDENDERLRDTTRLVRGFGNTLVGAFQDGERSAQDWFRLVLRLVDTIANNAEGLRRVFSGLFSGGGGGGGGGLGSILGLVSSAAGAFGGAPGIGSLGFATGGVAGPGGLMPFFAEGTPRVASTGPAVVHAGEMVVDADSAAVLRRYGIPTGGGGGDVSVTIVNRGAPLRVESQRRLNDRELEVVVSTAVDRARGEFEESLASGHGAWTRAIEGNLEAPRRYR